jgi:hypothetical protein
MPYALVNTCKEAWVSAGISAEHHVRRKDDKQTSSRADSVSRVDENHPSNLLSGCAPEGYDMLRVCLPLQTTSRIDCHLIHNCCFVHAGTCSPVMLPKALQSKRRA